MRIRPHPLAEERWEAELDPGRSILEILELADLGPEPGTDSPGRGRHLHVELNGAPIAAKWWARVRPKAGTLVTVRVVPHATVATVVATVAAAVVTSGGVIGGIAGAIAGLGFGIGGALGLSGIYLAAFGLTLGALGSLAVVGGLAFGLNLAIQALTGPPSSPSQRAQLSLGQSPTQSSASGGAGSGSPTISGASNDVTAFRPVWRVYGKHRITPPLGAKPFTEIVGGSMYLRMLMVPGFGPLRLSGFRVGDTPIDQFDDVEIEVNEGWDDGTPDQQLWSLDGDAANWTGVGASVADEGTIVQEGTGSLKITSDGNESEWGAERSDVGGADWQGWELVFQVYMPKTVLKNKATEGVRLELSDDGDFNVQRSAFQVPKGDLVGDAWTEVRLRINRDPDLEIGGVLNRQQIHGIRLFADFDSLPPAGQSVYFDDVRLERGRIALFPSTVDTLDLNIAIFDDKGLGEFVRTTELNTDEIALDFVFPGGVFTIDEKTGELEKISVFWTVEYAVAGSGDWKEPPDNARRENLRGTGKNVSKSSRFQGLVLTGMSWKVPRGQYDVRVTSGKVTRKQKFGQNRMVWTSLRSIRDEDPVDRSDVAEIGVRIKATDQLSGRISDFNCLAEAYLPVWDDGGGQWTAPKITRNPAWAYADVLRGSANKRPTDDSRIDTAALKTWADWCDAEGRTFDAVVDFQTTVHQAASDVAASSRAAFSVRDGKYSVIQDVEKTTPVQHITPRNSRNFRAEKAFPEIPHALKVQFLNASEDYKLDERIVYDDGFDENNATKFETLELFGITDSDEAWKDGRYHLATMRLRPETLYVELGMEHLVATRGDLVRVTHDAPLIGQAFGRVLAVEESAPGMSDVAAFVLDEETPLEAAGGGFEEHGVRIRLSDGTSSLAAVDEAASDAKRSATGEVRWIVLETPLSGGAEPEGGELVQYGLAGQESGEYVIKAVRPLSGPEFLARLTLVDHSPSIFQADVGAIPPHTPVVTRPRDSQPAQPRVDGIDQESGEFIIHLRPAPDDIVVAQYEAQIRLVPDGRWTGNRLFPVAEGAARVGPAVEGERYDLRVRSVSDIGVPSTWVTFTDVLFLEESVFAQAFEVFGLSITEGATATEFTGRTAELTWRVQDPQLRPEDLASPGQLANLNLDRPNPFFLDYEVRVLDLEGNVLRVAHVLDARFAYTIPMQLVDGGPRRTFTVDVAFRDVNRKVGERKALTVSNPAPTAPRSLSYSPGRDVIFADFAKPIDPDARGAVVLMSGSPGVSIDPANIVLRGVEPPLAIQTLGAGTNHYIRIAVYDEFAINPTTGEIDLALLNFSSEAQILSASSEFGIDVVESLVAGTVGTGDPGTIQATPSPGWTTDEHVGRRVAITSGQGEGTVRLIASNTADTLTLVDEWRIEAPPETGDDFDVLQSDIDDGILDSLHVRNLTIEFLNIANGAASRLAQDQEGTVETVFDGSGTDDGIWITVKTQSAHIARAGVPVVVNAFGSLRVNEIHQDPNLAGPQVALLPPWIYWRIIRYPTNNPPTSTAKEGDTEDGFTIIFDPRLVSGGGRDEARVDLTTTGYIPTPFFSPFDLPDTAEETTYELQLRWEAPYYDVGQASADGGALTIDGDGGQQWVSFVNTIGHLAIGAATDGILNKLQCRWTGDSATRDIQAVLSQEQMSMPSGSGGHATGDYVIEYKSGVLVPSVDRLWMWMQVTQSVS